MFYCNESKSDHGASYVKEITVLKTKTEKKLKFGRSRAEGVIADSGSNHSRDDLVYCSFWSFSVSFEATRRHGSAVQTLFFSRST